ncbi:GntR family transcriptional regulator [Qingshengfaniella alkalisoli]|uniref:GntR family transcriptional regulator n=1 Tax=Qingshengfaniella alkalisoli TaxID=2599296 RepID=A0A5B8J9T9_9RHOB|nr:GntR family transcriptional regulator [Qingshengfaniella alkalisoli]QDY71077.1 GntR family transcriptional regulator [Qingshengfaniella alkalisoli]
MSEAKDTVTTAVYDLLRKAIIEQALKPGMRLPEDTVGEQFGVSRTIARHALVRLENEGLVVARRNRGAVVAEPSEAEAHQVFDVRRLLENEVVRLLCRGMPPIGYDRLVAHIRSEEAVRGKDGPVSIRLSGEFHILLAELTENAVLARYVSEVVTRCSLIMSLYARSHSSDCAVDEHTQIVDAIRSGDETRAIDIMNRHLGAVKGRANFSTEPDDVRSILSQYGKELAQ